MAYEENEVLKRLPDHLRQFINNQDYESYTPIDQAVWRYVMRKNVDYLQKVAHESYIGGLKKTGISTEYIPSMYGMNRRSEEHTSELQSRGHLVCRLLLEKKKK